MDQWEKIMVKPERTTSWKQTIGYWAFILLLIPPCFEAALWLLQYRPYVQEAYSIHAEPSHCLIHHPQLGFALNPGHYLVTMNEGLRYHVTHGEDSLRITANRPLPDSLPMIYLMGCSYTYGMGVDDSLSFPYLLQQELRNVQVKNLGVPGFGTVQSLLQLRQRIKAGEHPALVMLNYADFHEGRNVLSPGFRHALSVGYQQSDESVNEAMGKSRVPYAELPLGKLRLRSCPWDSLYQDWRYRDALASVNFFQSLSDDIHLHQLEPQAVTLALCQEMKALCDSVGVPFLVTGLTQTSQTQTTLHQLQEAGISTLDISVDLRDPRFNNAPFDSHPNALAHQHYARKVGEWTSSWVCDGAGR
ncbi:MAG: hypothetical protein NWR72_02980 [Bacteroidia bacterium]|nr:hypothetical protein [Bacteroidia bacterium]